MDKPTLALSGYSEWFYCMAKNWKDVENRNKALPHFISEQLPIRIYLHASKTKTPLDELQFIRNTLTPTQLEEFNAVNFSFYRGKIIGEITIIKQFCKNNLPQDYLIFSETIPEYNSPWAFGKYCYVVKNGILYDKLIPYKGQLGFFKPDI